MYLLYGKFDLFLVAIRTDNSIVVLNEKLCETVKPGYYLNIQDEGNWLGLLRYFTLNVLPFFI